MSAEARFDGGQGKMTTGALRIALAGNPNCGKTTVFNAYTGARQHVGNYPGVTVDRKEGHVRHGNADITLVDLPGTYSLTAYSMEELVARAELGSGDVQAVINVVDASALERNLLLTVQMMEMGLPVEMAFMKASGAFATDNADELTLTPKGRYLLVVMMRQFFIGVNNLRDQARAALTGEERELIFG